MSIQTLSLSLAFAGLLAAAGCTAANGDAKSAKKSPAPADKATPAKAEGPKTSDFLARAKHPADNVWVAGQPTLDDLKAVKAAGVTVVVNLRAEGEPTGFADERATVEQLGLRYAFIPVAGAAGVTDDNAAKLEALLAETKADKVLLHCASGNRVGALMALIAFKSGKSAAESMQVGKQAGLTALTPVVKSKLEAAEKARTE